MSPNLHFVVLRSDLGEFEPVYAPLRYTGPVDIGGGFVLLCRNLDLEHHPYLSATVLVKEATATDGIGRVRALIPHNLVGAILEIESHKTPPGFSET